MLTCVHDNVFHPGTLQRVGVMVDAFCRSQKFLGDPLRRHQVRLFGLGSVLSLVFSAGLMPAASAFGASEPDSGVSSISGVDSVEEPHPSDPDGSTDHNNAAVDGEGSPLPGDEEDAEELPGGEGEDEAGEEPGIGNGSAGEENLEDEDPLDLDDLVEEAEGQESIEVEAAGLVVSDISPGSYSPTALARGVSRASGADRYGTSVAVSKRLFPGNRKAKTVFVASGTSYADGLTLGALAAYSGGPLLLTKRSSVPANVLAEIRRLQPERIIVAGGTGAISDGALRTLRTVTPKVDRVWGTTRYGTANEIAKLFPKGSPTMIATGTAFPDALVAGAASTKLPGNGGAVLLSQGFRSDAVLESALRNLSPSRVYIVGGKWSQASLDSVKSSAGTSRVYTLSGADRYATSAAVARNFWGVDSSRVLYATGGGYADALSAVPAAKAYNAPVLLTRRDCRPSSVVASAKAQSAVLIVGGSGVVNTKAVTSTCPVLPAKVTLSNGTYHFGMTQVGQANGYYCGPATAYMILHRLGYHRSASGVALSQGNLATNQYLATNYYRRTAWDYSKMSVGINNWMGRRLYVRKPSPSVAEFRSAVSNSFTKTGRPVVVDTQEYSGGAHYNGHPSYATFSHLMPVQSYNPGAGTITMLDPAAHFYSGSSREFSHSLSGFVPYLQKFGIYY